MLQASLAVRLFKSSVKRREDGRQNRKGQQNFINSGVGWSWALPVQLGVGRVSHTAEPPSASQSMPLLREKC
ncbi:hypothetical protein ACRRTK_020205 [Alexandromys fortis]